MPSTLTVTTSVDEQDPNDGVLSLREAIAAAKSGETINFADAVSGSSLTLGQLVIDKNLTIKGNNNGGNGFHATFISGNGRAFDVIGNINVTLANLGLGGFADHGGGVLNEGATLSLANCFVGGEAVVNGSGAAPGDVAGGAVFNAAGTVSLSNCEVVGQAIAYDSSSALGGGIYNAAGATLQATNCTFSGPFGDPACNALSFGGAGFSSGYAAGGAIYNAGGSVSLTNTRIDGASTQGRTALGGAIFSAGGNLAISNSTLDLSFALTDGDSPNAPAGGAIYVAGGSVQIQNSTITGNSAWGGVGNDICIAGGSVCISRNSIIGNVFGPYTFC